VVAGVTGAAAATCSTGVADTTTGAAEAVAGVAAAFATFLALGSAAAATGAGAAATTGATAAAAAFFATFAGAAGLEEEGVAGIISDAEEVLEDILRSSTGIIVDPGVEFFLLRSKNETKSGIF
jgi:ABC-type transport system involved in cytochrome bd biosynthesis fused ATPase/permease subunit